MNREDIIRMAKESGIVTEAYDAGFMNLFTAKLEGFAALVASSERKKCVEVIKDNWIYTANAEEMIYYILERGQA